MLRKRALSRATAAQSPRLLIQRRNVALSCRSTIDSECKPWLTGRTTAVASVERPASAATHRDDLSCPKTMSSNGWILIWRKPKKGWSVGHVSRPGARQSPRPSGLTTAPSRSAAAAPAAPDGSCDAYVECVRRLLARPSCWQAPFTAADERLAEAWHRAGIPLQTVRQALLLGCLRKSFALIDGPDAQPIGTLRYCEDPLEEVRGGSFPTAYWQHVESILERCEQHGRTQPATAPERRGYPGEGP